MEVEMLPSPWMNEDERTPEEIRRDRIRNLEHQEADLMRLLEKVRADKREIEAQ
jgi:hypothetical protein